MTDASSVDEKAQNDLTIISVEDESSPEPTKLSAWRMNSPTVQLCLCSFIVACTAGLYVTVNGLRTNGPHDSKTYSEVTDISTSIGNAIWVLSSLIGGATLNIIGPRWCMALGALAYPMYISGFWFYSSVSTDNAKYYSYMVSGVGSGCLFGFLWSVQNYLVTCYSKESEKGFYVALNWSLIKSGTVIGSLIGLLISKNQRSNAAPAHWYLYLIFIIINFVAVALSFLLCDPKDVRRSDGSKIAIFKRRSLWEECIALKDALSERRILLMIIPLFLAETLLPPSTTAGSFIFNTRTKALCNMMYWLFQLPSVFILQRILDLKTKSRKTRAYFGLALVYVFVFGSFMGFYIMYGSWGGLKTFDRTLPPTERPGIDWTERRVAGPLVWYIISGVLFGFFITFRLWLMSTLSNDPKKLGTYSGLIPACQAAGVALAFGINSTSIKFTSMFAIWFVLYGVSLPFLIIVIKYHVPETNYFMEEDVIVPSEVKEKNTLEIGESEKDA